MDWFSPQYDHPHADGTTVRSAIRRRQQHSHAVPALRCDAPEDLPALLADVQHAIHQLRELIPQYARAIIDRIEGDIARGAELALLVPLHEANGQLQQGQSYKSQLARCYPKLSPRELDVCTLIYEGFSSKQIADRLHTSTRNIEHHRYRVRRKLGLSGDRNLATLLTGV
jgi:DNA-binding NarL/FixJ family response regulator